MTTSTKDFITRKHQEIKWAEENGKFFVAQKLRESIERVIAYDKKQQDNIKQLTLW